MAEEVSNDDVLVSLLVGGDSHRPDGPIATYEQAVGVLNDHLEELLDVCSRGVSDPLTFLKEIANHVRISLNCFNGSAEPPFRCDNHNADQFVADLISCPLYSGIVAKLYSGIFSCDNEKLGDDVAAAAVDANLTDVDLLCVFLAMVALRVRANRSTARGESYVQILQSLKSLRDIYDADEWKNWPFTHLVGGNKARDDRTFDVLFGFDFRKGRKNKWVSVSRAYRQYLRRRKATTRVYVGKPVYDLFKFLPFESHEILFGERLSQILRLCYNYSASNVPYVLASDTHPVAADSSSLVPSGCRYTCAPPLGPVNNLTLVSRHAIPSARNLGIYLLNRETPLHPRLSLGTVVAECMVQSSIDDEEATVTCAESEIRCLEKHIGRLMTRNNRDTKERCGLCDGKLDVEPVFEIGTDEAAYNYFPLHAFMDTFEAVDKNCSASLCPDCLIHHVLFVYGKVSTVSVAISDVFRCPCCDEYMINWLGRASEVSRLCKRFIADSGGDEHRELKTRLIERIETCFSCLEMFQNDFMDTASPSSDYLPSQESKFRTSKYALRPTIPRFKLTEGNRYSLNCVQCISPLCCDKPDDLDVETVDAAPPPFFPDDRRDVEDNGFDDWPPNDEMHTYDDGPGTHRWPARLSCGFVASNAPQDDKEIETCAEAIALLGRIPQKKRRGWSTESAEGKAVVALANWYKNNRPPENMHRLLMAVTSVFKHLDCLCAKVTHYPFLPRRGVEEGVLLQMTASDEPLVAAYFRLFDKDCRTGQLMEYAGLFVRNLVSEFLLQMPECIYHRASSFVLAFADRGIVSERRPDEAADLDYVRSLNVSRRNMAMGNSEDSSHTPARERTVEWAVEKGGPKTVTCFNCGTPAVKEDGCVTVKCQVCYKSYCWLCEASTQNPDDPDHMITHHGLLYCTSVVARKAYEDFYNVEVATLKPHKFDESTDVYDYLLEDGFTFDVQANRAKRV